MAVMNREQWDLVLMGAGAGLAIGVAAGYFITDRTLRTKYEFIAESEIAEMRTYYAGKAKELQRYQEEVARQPKPHLDGIMVDLGYTSKADADDVVLAEDEERDQEAVEEEDETRNVFSAPQPEPGIPEWNYDRQLRDRSPEYPYVIHKDEFEEKENYTSETLSYFEGDDVLSDGTDAVIPTDQRDALVGEENLQKFGLGSGDPNIVYIRNDGRDVDYEIVRSSRTYAEEVHGFQHSDEPRRRRLRFDDE